MKTITCFLVCIVAWGIAAFLMAVGALILLSWER